MRGGRAGGLPWRGPPCRQLAAGAAAALALSLAGCASDDRGRVAEVDAAAAANAEDVARLERRVGRIERQLRRLRRDLARGSTLSGATGATGGPGAGGGAGAPSGRGSASGRGSTSGGGSSPRTGTDVPSNDLEACGPNPAPEC